MLGRAVREHRMRLGLSREDVARAAGLDVKTISNIEAGRVRPRMSTIGLLAGALGLDDDERLQLRSLADKRTGRGSWPGGRPVPAELPPDVPSFVGRADHLATLDAVLTGPASTAVVTTAVSGTAGVGKTALAVHWAHRVRGQFPDGQLYANLRGFDPAGQPRAPQEVIRRFLDALGVPVQRIPADLDAQVALYRSLLADKRVLIVLDNARDPAQVRPLLPATPACLTLVTSRDRLTGLVAIDGAHPLALDLLTPDEARQLLAARIGVDRVAAEPDAVDDLVALCARLPLALSIAAAHAATGPHRGLRDLVDALGDTRRALDVLSGDDAASDIRAVFSCSYQALRPEAARLYRLVGLHPGPDICAAAAAGLAGLAPDRTQPLLDDLARAHLLTEHRPGRYAFHDLLRAYATELVHAHHTEAERHTAIQRMLDHYLHTANTAALLTHPYRESITLPAALPGVTPRTLTDEEHATAWFAVEHATLVAAVRLAADNGFDIHTWQLAWTLVIFLDRHGHWHDHVAVQLAAVAAAERLGDTLAQGHAHRQLARAYLQVRRYDDVLVHLRCALDQYRQAGDLIGQAYIHHNLAQAWERQARYTEALDHAQRALDLHGAAGNRRGQTKALNAIGWYHALLGDHRQALAYCRQALAEQQESGDVDGQGETWDSLGYAHHHLAQYAEAVTCYENALDLFRNLDDLYNEAATLTHLGDTHHAAGDRTAARAAWQQALEILTDLNHPGASRLDTKLATIEPGVTAPR